MTVCPAHNRNAQEVIAILAATTARKISSPSPAKLALCRWLLPSVVKTLDCGFRFKFVLGYDEGDEYFDTPEGLAEITKWFEDNVQGTAPSCASLRQLTIVSLTLLFLQHRSRSRTSSLNWCRCGSRTS